MSRLSEKDFCNFRRITTKNIKRMKKPFFTILFLSIVSVSFSQNLKKELDSLFNKHIGEGQLHGCVTYVQQGDKVLQFESYGLMNIEANKKMQNDAIFRLASMSKLFTAVAALKLYEEGKFLLDDPVKKFLPQFADLKVKPDPKKDSLVALSRDVTIRDLFRTTAGFGETLTTEWGKTPDEFLDFICKKPLKYQPGSRWVYGGIELKVLGILVEKIAKKNLHDYLTEAFFKPLGMTSTGYYVKPENVERFSSFYGYENGKLKLVDNQHQLFDYFKLPDVRNGSAGMVSSAGDLANFNNMILHYGTFKGKQVLRPQTVELLISNQIDNIQDRGFAIAGFGFGTGVNQGRSPVYNSFVAKEPDNNNGKTKSIFWSGSPYNTRFLIDFDKQIIAIFLTQNSPWKYLDLMSKFEGIVNKDVN